MAISATIRYAERVTTCRFSIRLRGTDRLSDKLSGLPGTMRQAECHNSNLSSPPATQRVKGRRATSVKYHRSIRRLHAVFAFGITLQLLLSTAMRQPRPGRARTTLEAMSFVVHEYVGLALIAVLVAHWLIHMGRDRRGLVHFFPWFSRERMRRLAREGGDLMQLKLGAPEAQDAIAGAFQGLGLVVATLLALSGGLVYLGIADDGTMTETTRAIRRVHTTLAPLMWGYLGIHVAAALAHVVAGHRSVLTIFRLHTD